MSLIINNFTVLCNNKKILHNIDLEINKGELVYLLGPNGSGKSTLAQAIMSNPSYLVKPGKKLILDGKDISDFETHLKAREGIFLGFQTPFSIPGVTLLQLLRESLREAGKKHKDIKAKNNPALSVWGLNKKVYELSKKLNLSQDILTRGINEDFSGGEKKKAEIIQAIILSPKYAIFDEIDTGLDIDSLKDVVTYITLLLKRKTGVLVITHNQKLFSMLKPDKVYIMKNGKIDRIGRADLLREIEEHGFSKKLQ